MWATMANWFTPTVLFCLLNLIVGTIFLTSNFKSHKKYLQQQTHQPDDDINPHNPTELIRAPSSLLDRVRSINFSLYRSDSIEFHPAVPLQTDLVRAPSILDRVRSFDFSKYGFEHPDPNHKSETIHDPGHDHHMTRSKSDNTGEVEDHTEAAEAEKGKMRKSASAKFRSEEEPEKIVLRRPATVREGNPMAWFGEDEGVDAKADDFINRFKQQLKLQRLDSLLRYKEMLTRGSGK